MMSSKLAVLYDSNIPNIARHDIFDALVKKVGKVNTNFDFSTMNVTDIANWVRSSLGRGSVYTFVVADRGGNVTPFNVAYQNGASVEHMFYSVVITEISGYAFVVDILGDCKIMYAPRYFQKVKHLNGGKCVAVWKGTKRGRCAGSVQGVVGESYSTF